MSGYIPAELRRLVSARDQRRCAYCQCAAELMGITFEIDHIIPEAAGGQIILENLCLACPACNRYKGDRLTALDPGSQQEVTLFHPLRETWSTHFTWAEDGAIVVGLTLTGRATVAALRMNRPVLVQVRRYWVVLGLHPPG